MDMERNKHIDTRKMWEKIGPLISDEALKGEFLQLLGSYDRYSKELTELHCKYSDHLNGLGDSQGHNDPETRESGDYSKPGQEDKTSKDGSPRDTSRYIFNNGKYNKRRLVYECVKHYAETEPDITIEKMKETFPAYLQGSFGVFKTQKDMEIEKRDDNYKKRFFQEPIYVNGEPCYVSMEWGKDNIDVFYKKMLENGFDIKKVDK